MSLDPRQQEFRENYINPESSTFGNAYASAVAAGFTKDYAKTILNKGNKWVEEIVRDLERTQEADKVLDHHLKKKSLEAAKFVNKAKYHPTQRVDVTTKGDKIEVQVPTEVIKETVEFYENKRKKSLKDKK